MRVADNPQTCGTKGARREKTLLSELCALREPSETSVPFCDFCASLRLLLDGDKFQMKGIGVSETDALRRRLERQRSQRADFDSAKMTPRLR